MECKKYKEDYELANKNAENLQSECTELRANEKKHLQNIISIKNQLESSKSTQLDSNSQYLNVQHELKNSLEKIRSLEKNNQSLEAALINKEDCIEEMQGEIKTLRDRQNNFEEKEESIFQLQSGTMRELDELRARAKKAELVKDSYHRQLSSNEDLRRELEKTTENNSFLSKQLREATKVSSELQQQQASLEDRLSHITRERDQYYSDARDLEAMANELSKTVQAEQEIARNANLRGDGATRGKEFMDQQLEEMRTAYGNMMDENSALESELCETKAQMMQLSKDLSLSREKAAMVDAALAEAAGAQALASEVECLRAQLSDVRKQLIKRDIEEDANSVSPRAVLEREAHTRQVYETIILELRSELDRVNGRYHETSQRLEDATGRAARVEHLEEEILLLRDTAKVSAVESQSIAMSASDAMERSVRSLHEIHTRTSDLRRVELELQAAMKEVTRLKEELAEEKVRHKNTYIERLAAERKAAELTAAKSRLEVEQDGMKQNAAVTSIELTKLQRQVQEQTVTIMDHKKNSEALARFRDEASSLRLALQSSKHEAMGREQEVNGELQMLRQTKALLQREAESLRASLETNKRGYENALSDGDRQRQEIEDLRAERVAWRKEGAMQENSRAEAQLLSLRRDLEQTVQEWRQAERDKVSKEEAVRKLQVELSREREKASLFKTQVELLDERLRVAYQELSVYRSLDVYHTSMQTELQSFRIHKGDAESIGVPHIKTVSLNSPRTGLHANSQSAISTDDKSRFFDRTGAGVYSDAHHSDGYGRKQHSYLGAPTPEDHPTDRNNLKSFKPAEANNYGSGRNQKNIFSANVDPDQRQVQRGSYASDLFDEDSEEEESTLRQQPLVSRPPSAPAQRRLSLQDIGGAMEIDNRGRGVARANGSEAVGGQAPVPITVRDEQAAGPPDSREEQRRRRAERERLREQAIRDELSDTASDKGDKLSRRALSVTPSSVAARDGKASGSRGPSLSRDQPGGQAEPDRSRPPPPPPQRRASEIELLKQTALRRPDAADDRTARKAYAQKPQDAPQKESTQPPQSLLEARRRESAAQADFNKARKLLAQSSTLQ